MLSTPVNPVLKHLKGRTPPPPPPLLTPLKGHKEKGEPADNDGRASDGTSEDKDWSLEGYRADLGPFKELLHLQRVNTRGG